MEELSEKFSISMDSVINSSNENKIIEENEQIEECKASPEEEEPIRFYEWTDEMSEESQKILDEDDTTIENSQKLEHQAGKYWHVFYTRNTNIVLPFIVLLYKLYFCTFSTGGECQLLT